MKIHLRKCDLSDLNDIFLWRNDPETVLNSLSGLGITLDEHKQWFFEKIFDVDNFVGYICENSQGKKIGFVFFVRKNFNNFEVSINMNPIFRGSGLSIKVLVQSLKSFQESSYSNIFARIKINNIKSEKLFIRAGFEINLSDSNNAFKTYKLAIK
jgi:N-acetylneuraminate synthase